MAEKKANRGGIS